MVTQPQTPEGDAVPRYFTDFVLENARQHAELSDRIWAADERFRPSPGGVR